MPNLEAFGFVAMWSPYFFLFVAALIAMFLIAIGPKREQWFPGSEPVTGLQKSLFVTGLALLYVALGSPIDLAGHLMFTWHMASMSIAFLIAPSLLLAGAPAFMLRAFGRLPVIRRMGLLLNPLVTILFFNVLFSFYHMPAIHDVVMTNYAVHTVVYMLLFLGGMLMWWPVMCPIPELNKLTEVRKMGYIFANGVLLTPACALIIFAKEPMYATYTDPVMWATAMGFCLPGGSAAMLDLLKGPESFAIMPAIEDQQLGGVIMKLVQEVVYGSTLAYVFYHWFRRENPRGDDMDPVPAP